MNKNIYSKLFQRSPLLKIQYRNFLNSIGSQSKVNSSEMIKVYASPEWDKIAQSYKKFNSSETKAHIKQWNNTLKEHEQVNNKYYALLPLFFENNFAFQSDQRYIVSMDLIPEKKLLNFYSIESTGLVNFVEAIPDISPFTNQDYTFKKSFLTNYLPKFIDGDLIYVNRKSKATYLFDKEGTWYNEGLNNEALSLDKTFNEKTWFDHTYWGKKWQ